VERAGCPIHEPGEDAPAQFQNIQIQDLAEISRSSKGPPDASQAGSDIRCPRYVKCKCYIYMDETFTLQLAKASEIGDRTWEASGGTL
jgi:hypothetical protein